MENNIENRNISESIKKYELLADDVRFQLGFINNYHTFDFDHLNATLNQMKDLQEYLLDDTHFVRPTVVDISNELLKTID